MNHHRRERVPPRGWRLLSGVGEPRAPRRASAFPPSSIGPAPGQTSRIIERVADAFHQLDELAEVGDEETPKVALRGSGFSGQVTRSEEHTSELQSRGQLVCRLLLEKNED